MPKDGGSVREIRQKIRLILRSMKLKLHNYFELVGLVVVLLATTLQFTLLSEIVDVAEGGYLVRIDEKVNQIWYQVSDTDVTDEERYQRATS